QGPAKPLVNPSEIDREVLFPIDPHPSSGSDPLSAATHTHPHRSSPSFAQRPLRPVNPPPPPFCRAQIASFWPIEAIFLAAPKLHRLHDSSRRAWTRAFPAPPHLRPVYPCSCSVKRRVISCRRLFFVCLREAGWQRLFTLWSEFVPACCSRPSTGAMIHRF
uniref:Uncharacterized protein n=2 Tax=Aegilops tauschii subsp. strangulata TaxID=200361 RepID=A0A453DKJ8_AEGTS